MTGCADVTASAGDADATGVVGVSLFDYDGVRWHRRMEFPLLG